MLCPGGYHHTGETCRWTCCAPSPPTSRPSLLQADGARLSFADATFDAVVSIQVLSRPPRLATLACRDAARAASAGAPVGQIPPQRTDTGCFLIAQVFAARNKMIRDRDKDGLFEADPKQHPAAEIILRISVQDLVQPDPTIRLWNLLNPHHIPEISFADGLKSGHLTAASAAERVGTSIYHTDAPEGANHKRPPARQFRSESLGTAGGGPHRSAGAVRSCRPCKSSKLAASRS
jgi:hypothetical protein